MDLLSITRYLETDDDKKRFNENEKLQKLLLSVERRMKDRRIHYVNLDKSSDRDPGTDVIKDDETCEIKNPIVTDKCDDIHREDFTIFEPENVERKEKVKRVLPVWLTHPKVIPVDLSLTTNVCDMPLLDERLKQRLMNYGRITLFPVQSVLIHWILKNHLLMNRFWPPDACVCTPTGSGKTLSYVLPIVQILSSRAMMKIRALVVVPTKNLAAQVYKVFIKYTVDFGLKVIQLGKIAKFEKEQIKIMQYDNYNASYEIMADIVVTTPGRLVDHMIYSKGFTLDSLKFLVVDEADNVMISPSRSWFYILRYFLRYIGGDESAAPALINVVRRIPFRPQRLFFSATLSQDPEILQSFGLFEPFLFTSVVKTDMERKSSFKKLQNEDFECESQQQNTFIGKYITPIELEECITVCSLAVKPAVLYYWIKANSLINVMCFVDRVSNVRRLCQLLTYLSSTDPEMKTPLIVKGVSSELRSKEHAEIVSAFAKNQIHVLVTTDAMARGVDFKNVMCVIIYDAPKQALTYVHRVGRTARAGNRGLAITLVTPKEEKPFLDILKSTGKDIIHKATPDMSQLKKIETAYKSALEVLQISVKKEKRANMKKISKAKAGWKETYNKKRRYQVRKYGKIKSVKFQTKMNKRKLKQETPGSVSSM